MSLKEAYDSACPVHKVELAIPSLPDIDIEQWVKAIYKNGIEAGLHGPSVRAFAELFIKALEEGYGNITDIDFTSPDGVMIQHLKDSIYTFSFAKNKAELKSITEMVMDADGKVKSFTAFKKEAAKITELIRGPWLEAEYELAVAGSQMASKWVEFERTGKDSLLKYSTVKDARVSDICRPLEGVTKPLNDKFWDMYYPPNHFRCRCDVDRLVSGAVTPDGKTELPTIPKLLRTNLAKEKLLFPKNHPYYNE